MNTPVVDPPAAETSVPSPPQAPESLPTAPKPAPRSPSRKEKLLKCFKTGGGRVGLCACVAALVVAVAIVVLLIRGGTGGTLDGWPEDELLAGVASPEQGEVNFRRTGWTGTCKRSGSRRTAVRRISCSWTGSVCLPSCTTRKRVGSP